jgi:hypothetical protein
VNEWPVLTTGQSVVNVGNVGGSGCFGKLLNLDVLLMLFTDKRIIAVNVQGITGKKKDYTSLPYSKIVVFSVETAGTFDLDSELELYFSGLGKVKFDFTGQTDVAAIARTIGGFVL